MKRGRNSNRKGEGGLALWIIVLAILGGAVWFLYSSRTEAEGKAKKFADQIVESLAVKYDVRFLNAHMTPQAQITYIPSWRDRMVQQLKSFGPLAKPIETKGKISFNSVFFDPHGMFETELVYPTMTAKLNVGVSRGMNAWQVEDIELIWTPPPTPTPAPTVAASPSPTPTPTPEPQKPRRKRNR